uniref:WxxW domain-containing protein n=1 Tax=Salvator merianae TaxID=96440 RepID=A0A8D0BPV2_SALMN
MKRLASPSLGQTSTLPNTMGKLQNLILVALLVLPTEGSRCTTYWFDRDDPSGKGDYEILSELRKEYPGEICAQPIGIEAETLEGQPASTTGQIFKLSSPSEGFACVNQDQKGGFCQDYKVRFICPPDFCSACKTQWFDRDDPSGHGDFETLAELRREYPDQICPRPIQIEARTLSGVLASETGQNISKFDTTVGFVCVHAHQKPLQFCHDYKVQFTCPESFCSTCKTQWFDRDDPSGHGDYETLAELRKEYPNQICQNPIRIEARTLSG